MVKVKFKKLHPDAKVPEYKTEGAAGMDICYCPRDRNDPGCIFPGQWALLRTGIAIELPPGHEAQVRPRSGLALHNGVTVLNAPGTIDADFSGEIGVILINHSNVVFHLVKGDRIAQLVFAKVSFVRMEEVKELSETIRGEGGFGHSGTK